MTTLGTLSKGSSNIKRTFFGNPKKEAASSTKANRGKYKTSSFAISYRRKNLTNIENIDKKKDSASVMMNKAIGFNNIFIVSIFILVIFLGIPCCHN